MKYRGHDPKRDANELEIVRTLQAVGATVLRLDDFDLLVGWRGINYLMEVKMEKGRLNEKQIELFDWWRGQQTVVRTPDQALEVIGAL